MKLQPEPFDQIKRGQKTIELRLYDEKRKEIAAGDRIVFTNVATGESLSAAVVALHVFDSFATLYRMLPLLKCGYTEETLQRADPADMERYYSVVEQAKYGVVGIELSQVQIGKGEGHDETI